MNSLGLWMLLAAVLLVLATGAPVYGVLLGTACAFAAFGVAVGAVDAQVLTAVPARIVGLLDQDLLQALPLYALVGALLNRTALAGILLRIGARLIGHAPLGTELAGLGLGALLAPMNGAVGANVSMLSHTLAPALQAQGSSPARATALVCVASTLGVVIPPSLVLILLGDAMLRAHTEALNTTHAAVRIVNTQDVLQATLLPGALVLLGGLLVVWLTRSRHPVPASAPQPSLTRTEWATGLLAGGSIVALLGLVATGWLYAVEGAASGGLLLLLYGLATRQLRWPVLRAALDDAARTTGMVFALLVAATCCSLLVRAFGSDALLADAITRLGATPGLALLAVLLVLGLSALVLDAFELVFLVVPIAMPPLLTVVPDAAWVACLTLLVLQTGFLLPPFGYAVLASRANQATPSGLRALTRALLPFLAVQLAVIGLVAAVPQTTHWLRSNGDTVSAAPLDGAALERALKEAVDAQQVQEPAATGEDGKGR